MLTVSLPGPQSLSLVVMLQIKPGELKVLNINSKIQLQRRKLIFIFKFFSLGYEWLIDSLHKCNEQEGGPELNVDITTHFENKFPPVKPEILQSYTDVCTCKNIPKYVEDMSKWSIDNHGNELLAYFEPNCEEKKSEALQINAGHWINSRDMHTHIKYSRGTTLQILSFGPNPNTTYFKTSCKNAWKGNPEKKEEKSNELSAERMDEKFKAVETKIEVLESHFEHSKRKLDLCQNNVDKLQRKYAKDMKNVTGDFKILEKDNEDLNENNLKLGNIMLNVTGIVQGLQLVNLNLKSKVRTLEEKAKRAQLEQDLSMEDKFKLQMEQFQRLLNELSSKKHH